MSTGHRIKQRRQELGLSVGDVADRLGVSLATVYRYEKGDIEKLPGTMLEPLARLLHTTPAWLMDWGIDDEFSYPPRGWLPLLGRIACGVPLLADANVTDFVPPPPAGRADFALRCRGDSMTSARIFDGDIVYIRACADVENGEIAAVLLGDEATLKKVYRIPGRLTLRAENPMFADMVFTGAQAADVRILGKAVAFYSTVQHEADSADGEWRSGVGMPIAARGGGVTVQTEQQARRAWMFDQHCKKTGEVEKSRRQSVFAAAGYGV